MCYTCISWELILECRNSFSTVLSHLFLIRSRIKFLDFKTQKKQNSSYLTITKGSWEQIYLATKKHMALGGFNKQLHFLEEFLKQLKFPQSFRYQVLRFKENIHEFRRVGIVWNILIHPWKKTDITGWKIHHLDEMYQKIMMTTEIFPWKLHINET